MHSSFFSSVALCTPPWLCCLLLFCLLSSSSSSVQAADSEQDLRASILSALEHEQTAAAAAQQQYPLLTNNTVTSIDFPKVASSAYKMQPNSEFFVQRASNGHLCWLKFSSAANGLTLHDFAPNGTLGQVVFSTNVPPEAGNLYFAGFLNTGEVVVLRDSKSVPLLWSSKTASPQDRQAGDYYQLRMYDDGYFCQLDWNLFTSDGVLKKKVFKFNPSEVIEKSMIPGPPLLELPKPSALRSLSFLLNYNLTVNFTLAPLAINIPQFTFVVTPEEATPNPPITESRPVCGGHVNGVPQNACYFSEPAMLKGRPTISRSQPAGLAYQYTPLSLGSAVRDATYVGMNTGQAVAQPVSAYRAATFRFKLRSGAAQYAGPALVSFVDKGTPYFKAMYKGALTWKASKLGSAVTGARKVAWRFCDSDSGWRYDLGTNRCYKCPGSKKFTIWPINQAWACSSCGTCTDYSFASSVAANTQAAFDSCVRTSGNFLDIRNGGECWTCTTSSGVRGDRTAAPVFASNACRYQSCAQAYSSPGAFYDLLTDSCWSCGSKSEYRSGTPVTSANSCTYWTCQNAYGSDSFVDVSQTIDGLCYSCGSSGSRVLGTAVTASDSCIGSCPSGSWVDVLGSKRCVACPANAAMYPLGFWKKETSCLVNCAAQYSNGFDDLKGNCYTCPAEFHWDVLYSPTHPYACTKYPRVCSDYVAQPDNVRGIFVDRNGGECWTCPANSVANMFAEISQWNGCVDECEKKYTPSSFLDIFNGRCVTCPSGMFRNLNPISSADSCTGLCSKVYSHIPNVFGTTGIFKGECYSCPEPFTFYVGTALEPVKKMCRIRDKATYNGVPEVFAWGDSMYSCNGTGFNIGLDCYVDCKKKFPPGGFYSLTFDNCYTCGIGRQMALFEIEGVEKCAYDCHVLFPGSFFDSIHGGTCWKCRTGLSKPSFTHVENAMACQNTVFSWSAKRSSIGLLRVPGAVEMLSRILSNTTHCWNTVKSSLENQTLLALDVINPGRSTLLRNLFFERFVEILMNGPTTAAEERVLDFMRQYIRKTRIFLHEEVYKMYKNFLEAYYIRQARNMHLSFVMGPSYELPDFYSLLVESITVEAQNRMVQGTFGAAVVMAGLSLQFAAVPMAMFTIYLKLALKLFQPFSFVKDATNAVSSVFSLAGPALTIISNIITGIQRGIQVMEQENAEPKFLQNIANARKPFSMNDMRNLLSTPEGSAELLLHFGFVCSNSSSSDPIPLQHPLLQNQTRILRNFLLAKFSQ